MPTVTMSDIARLAGVQRPVVSVWRGRPRTRGGRYLPFPAPVNTSTGVEHFDRSAVVGWLQETGRGNNPEAALDAGAFVATSGADLEAAVALLILRTQLGADLEGLTGEELATLAGEIDPGDEYLNREIADCVGHPQWQTFVDEVAESAFGPQDAYQRLTSGRLGRAEQGLDHTTLALLRAVLGGVRRQLPGSLLGLPEDPALAWVLGQDVEAVRAPLRPWQRASARRAVLQGLILDPTAAAGTLWVRQLMGVDPDRALAEIAELDLELGPSDAAVVVAPASLLCGRLRGTTAADRAQTLRLGHLALGLRLPRGGWQRAPRQALGVWVLSGRHRPDDPLRLADLSAQSVDLDDLASDVSAAVQGTDARAYRYARVGDLARILAGGEVVPPGVRAVQYSGETSLLDAVYAASLTTSADVAGFDVTATESSSQIRLTRRSLSQLLTAGQLRMVRGNRIDTTRHTAAGTVRVLTGDGEHDAVRLDPLDVVAVHPHAVRTEPGDVVFTPSPPRARVDEVGGAVVCSPSRIIRLAATAQVGPYLLAATINEFADPGTEWQTWAVPDFAGDDLETLEATLAAAATHQELLTTQLRATSQLSSALIRGVAAGAVRILPPTNHPSDVTTTPDPAER